MNFSKSKYKQLCQCDKLLWLDTFRRELRTQDDALASSAETGVAITELARGYFGDYTDVTVMNGDRPDLAAMVQRTAECMEQGMGSICEASFVHDGLYCAVDILHRENGGYAIYEVKSSTDIRKSKPKNKDGEQKRKTTSLPKVKDQYDIDVAYQKYVLEHCGVNVTGVYILTLDPDYEMGETLDIRGMFKCHDMSAYLPRLMEELPERLAQARALLASEEPVRELGPHCFDPHECPYWHHCAAHIPEQSVFDLYNIRTKKWKLYEQNVVSYPELEDHEDLGELQKRQVRFALHDCGTHIDREKIREFLDGLSYPLYFLDFEAMQLPVPQFPGSKPYAQIPFQYSLHYITEPGGELMHKEFLAVSGEDPRRAIAEALCRDIPADVCVTAYNMSYERKRLEELAERFPDLSAHLSAIRENIVDLLVPFQEGWYYNRAMGGSFSIKSVLPALFPDDPELDYHNLEGVHNGGEAMDIFPRIQHMTPEDREKARKNLLAYCKLDTYAMVKVWQKLCEAVEEP